MPEGRAEVESVEWASLEVHGRPDDVPMALQAIRSGDEDLRMLGYRLLSDRLSHGGTCSPAAIAAVPFLIAAVADPAEPVKSTETVS